MAVLLFYGLLGSAAILCVAAQKDTVNPSDRPMSKSRTEMVELLAKLQGHPAIQNRLSPSSPGTKVNISVDIVVKQVFGIDELTQIIDSFVHFRVNWHDYDLTWIPQEFSGLEQVHLDKDKIWYPILNIINAGDSESFVVDADQVVSLWYNGTAQFHSTKFLKSTCNVDLTDYPTDVQKCQINVVPSVATPDVWIEHGQTIETQEGRFEVKGAWKIVSKSMEHGNTARYSYINVHLKLQRRGLFYAVCLLLPLFSTSLLTVFVFLIPPNAGEKVSFLVSIVLANTMMLNLLGWLCAKRRKNCRGFTIKANGQLLVKERLAYDKTSSSRIEAESIIPHSIDKMPSFLLFIVGVIVQNLLAFVCTLIVIRKHEQEQTTEAHGMFQTASQLGAQLNNSDQAFTDPRRLTSKNVIYSTGKSFQRSVRTSSNAVSPDSTSAATSGKEVQSSSGGCFPCRTRLKDWYKKVISIRASTLDKIFFIVFLLVFLVFTAIVMI